jgi:hypothetical protein
VNKNSSILIKCTGGATAQLLALSNAIYISNKTGRSFKIKYYPYSTGTYWTFAIGDLLTDEEIENEGTTKGLSTEGLKSGQFIKNFPSRQKRVSYERILQFIHFLRLDSKLRKIRREIVIGGKRKNLYKINHKTNSVSGNYVPLVDKLVNKELSKRFTSANLPDPFGLNAVKKEFVIHYRLGDMRKMPARNKVFGGHGVVDPVTFRQILKLENFDIDSMLVKVVSDEPIIAKQLLKDVGINSEIDETSSNLWKDLRVIGSAKVFIGSMSQFSLFGATITATNQGRVYLPSSIYGEGKMTDVISDVGFNYFDYLYLPKGHYVFSIL